MGTAAGLMLGLRAANLRSQLISVRVNSENFVNTKGMMKLIRKANSLLCSLDSSFPRLDFLEGDMGIRHGFWGQQYALFTNEGIEAITCMKKREGIKLEGTYTGKAFAALVDDAKNKDLLDKVVLFWNTLNSRDFSDAISTVDYHSLPRCFYRYFEEEVQPLDRDS
jgi:D-cysteine desulfhydrase